MIRQYWRALLGLFVAVCMFSLALLTIQAAGDSSTWSTGTFDDFSQGTPDRVDVWSQKGMVQLDHNWWPNVRTNDAAPEGKVYSRVAFVLTNTGSITETHFLAVWEDERPSNRLDKLVHIHRIRRFHPAP